MMRTRANTKLWRSISAMCSITALSTHWKAARPLALADVERAKKGIADRLQDKSGRLKAEPGKVTFLGDWPGGKGKLVLAFEVPAQAKELTLLRTAPQNRVTLEEKPIPRWNARYTISDQSILNKTPVYVCIGLFFILLLAALNFVLRYKFFKVVYLFFALVPVFLSAIPFVKNDIEPYLSSKQACEYLMSNYKVSNTILTSKVYARGVKFYTGSDIAVTAIPGPNFFSPHPIPFLNNDRLVLDFLNKQKVTYCVLKKSSFEDIQRITSNRLNYQLLKVIGNEYIVKVE